MTVTDTQRVRRTDRVAIGAVKRTPAGVLVVPASVSRTGLQTYRTHDGGSVIEYRPESEVFAPAALESLKGAKVTVGHTFDRKPPSVGVVSDREPTKAVRDGESFVDTSLLITDPAVIERIDRKELVEISLDYTAVTDRTPGVTPSGARYDAVQRSIEVHSAALLEPGGARAGREARIRLDGNEEFCHTTTQPESEKTHPMTEPAPKPIVKIKLDGKEFVEGSAEHIGHLNAAIEAGKAEVAAATAKLAAAESATAGEKARADGLATELTAARANVPQAVADELAFRDSVKALLPVDYKFDAKDRTTIKRDAIGKDACARVDAQPEASRSAYLDGAVHFALDQKRSGTPSYKVNSSVKTDSSDVNPLVAASDAMYKAGRA